MFFHWLEKNPFYFASGISIVISFAGLLEIVPNFAEAARPLIDLKPRTVLQIAGKNVYMKDNCISCHSQMIRPFKSETDRYGDYSLSGEYVYDRPFLWGSKRTGPDLARVGGLYSDDWQRAHLYDPRSVVPESNMPAFPWLFENKLDLETLPKKLRALRMVGVPYTDEQIENAAKGLEDKTEADALIAYLQQLGLLLQERR